MAIIYSPQKNVTREVELISVHHTCLLQGIPVLMEPEKMFRVLFVWVLCSFCTTVEIEQKADRLAVIPIHSLMCGVSDDT